MREAIILKISGAFITLTGIVALSIHPDEQARNIISCSSRRRRTFAVLFYIRGLRICNAHWRLKYVLSVEYDMVPAPRYLNGDA